ncbi:MAG: hypothetical protein ACYTGW_15895 [Planctomycetota bacterium]|jgi:hypothetical protein
MAAVLIGVKEFGMNWVLRVVAAAVALISVVILAAQGLALIEIQSGGTSLGLGTARSEFISTTVQAAALLLVSIWVLDRANREPSHK